MNSSRLTRKTIFQYNIFILIHMSCNYVFYAGYSTDNENNSNICSHFIMRSRHKDKNWFEELRLWLESKKNNIAIAYSLWSQDFFLNHLCFLHSISSGFLYVRPFKILKSQLFGAFTLSYSWHDMSNAGLKKEVETIIL